MSTDTAPKTHRGRAMLAANIAFGTFRGFVPDRFGEIPELTQDIARETYPTELVDAARRVLAPHQTPETLDKALADLDAALVLYEEKP